MIMVVVTVLIITISIVVVGLVSRKMSRALISEDEVRDIELNLVTKSATARAQHLCFQSLPGLCTLVPTTAQQTVFNINGQNRVYNWNYVLTNLGTTMQIDVVVNY